MSYCLSTGGNVVVEEASPRSVSCLCIVPVSFARGYSGFIPFEASLEVVENGELVPRHDVRVRLGLYLRPYSSQRAFKDSVNGRVLRTLWALSGNLQGLGNSSRILGVYHWPEPKNQLQKGRGAGLDPRRAGQDVLAGPESGVAERIGEDHAEEFSRRSRGRSD
ncbi:hypothetical protein VTK73DRAFT_3330 [Phialemonium thermophilum]|uniref:Uncharacterized protein n=1 Tax=Phialemonium thermophilum TaxID=223376 RepID=A0ABR3X0R5_9PEZI